MAFVHIQDVKKIYPGEVVALHRSSLEIHDKEFMVLVGPSGCGKSTTLRMVAGLEEITEGKIYIGDRLINDVAPKDRDIAMVFQNYALYPHMTIFDNMAFGLKLRKLPKADIRQKVETVAASLGLTPYLARKPKALSGGQRQRVALGRAIVREPAVFLFDEPLSNLDAKMRVEMRKELSILHRRLETTILYVTHDQVEAMTLGSRICVMSEGRIQQVGTPLEVYDRPKNVFVAKFIGTPPMNILEGTLAGKVFSEASLTVDVSQRLKGKPTPKAYLGVRPEDVELAAGREGDFPVRFKGTIEVIERLGDEQLLYCTTGANPFIAKVDSHVELNFGQECVFGFHPDNLHVFDEHEVNISLEDSFTPSSPSL